MSYFDQIVIRDPTDPNKKATVNEFGELYSAPSGHVEDETTTPLGSGSVWTSNVIDLIDTSIVLIGVHSDQPSETNGLKIDWSANGIDWFEGEDVFTILPNRLKSFSFQPVLRYLRVRYVNGSVAQTSFTLSIVSKHTYTKPSSHRIADSVSDQDDAELVKSIITAQKPNNGFVNIGSTVNNNLRVAIQEYGDTPAIDSFARLRVSTPYTIFDSKQLHDKQPLFWAELSGSVATSSFNNLNADTDMQVSASANSFVVRQTKQRFNYQPGKSQLAFMTFRREISAGTRTRIGLYDGQGTNNLTPRNGVFLESYQGTTSWNIVKNGTIVETVSQSNWNVDTLDGSNDENNPSGILFYEDACQIIIIDYEWLGVGRVRVGFVIDGLIYYVHYFNHSNNPAFTSVYMKTPNLPLRYSIESDGSGQSTLQHICSSVISEGGIEQTGILRSVDRGTTHLDANTADTSYALIGIRLKSTYYDVSVVPEYASVITETETAFRWSLQYNPTVAGTFTYSDIPNSSLQQAQGTTANTITTPGLIVDSGYVSVSDKAGGSGDRRLVTALRLGIDLAGNQDTLVLCVTALSANADILGGITIRELL